MWDYVQCLLFVVHKGKIPDRSCSNTPAPVVRQEQITVFALVPQHHNYNSLRLVLAENGVTVIEHTSFDPVLSNGLKSDQVEVVEVLLDKELTDYSGRLLVRVLNFNKEFLAELFVNCRIVEDYSGSREILPLHCLSRALEEETLDRIKHLMSFSPDIRHRCEDSGTLLHFAVALKHEPLVRVLLENGASVNNRTLQNYSPLHIAVLTHKLPVSILELLIQHNPDVNATVTNLKYKDATPLHLAFNEYRSDLAKILLDSGARVNADCCLGSVLELAANSDGLEIVLSHYPDKNIASNQAALRAALRNSDPKKKNIDLLLEYGFELVPDDANDAEILFGAVRSDSVQLAEKLLQWGTSVHSRSNTIADSMTLLHEAAEKCGEDMIALLLTHGADIKAECGEGGTPVRSAATSGNINALKSLLAHGARCRDDPLLLHTVIQNADPEIDDYLEPIKFLVENKADINSLNDEGATPLLIAYQCEDANIMELLFRHGAQMSSLAQTSEVFFGAINYNQLDIVKAFVHNCPDVDAMSDGALLKAIKAPSPDVVQFFLEASIPSWEIMDEVGILNEGFRTKDRDIVINVLEFGSLNLSVFARSSINSILQREYSNFESVSWNDFLEDWSPRSPRSPSSPESEMTRGYVKEKIYRKHLIAIKAADLTINKDASYIELEDLLHDSGSLQKTSEGQVAAMRNKKIGETDISFYDFLDASMSKIMHFTRNNALVEFLKTETFGSEFSLYSGIISKRFRRAYYRRKLVNYCNEIFDRWLGQSYKLPLEIKEKILDYLNNQNLHLLIHAYEAPSEEMVPAGEDQ